jgi:transposase
MVRYRHLQTWLDSVQRKLGNWRDYFYWGVAKRLTTTTAEICVEDFDIRKVAKRPKPENPEDQGEEKARSNRQIAAVSDLRGKILKQAAKYHCRVVEVPAENNTRRCDVCGELHPWDPKKKIMHVCANPDCGAEWDQDVNNTDRQHSRIASGEVVPLVIPAEKAENGQVVGAKSRTFRTARKELHNLVKSQ